MSTLSLPTDTFNLFPADALGHVMQFARMPMTTFTVQEVNLPSVTARSAMVGAPGMNIRHLPDRLTYDPLSVTFLVDEEFRAWRELYSWMYGMTGGPDRSVVTAEFIESQVNFVYPEKPSAQLDKAGRTTAGLTILNAAKIPMLRFIFHNVYVTSLGQVQFSTTALDPIVPLTCQATFDYDYYSVVEIRR
jgi:hypothetical protein